LLHSPKFAAGAAQPEEVAQKSKGAARVSRLFVTYGIFPFHWGKMTKGKRNLLE